MGFSLQSDRYVEDGSLRHVVIEMVIASLLAWTAFLF
jgi:hypothetical protein